MSTDSPALSHQSDGYPMVWGGKVPRRVRVTETVTADFPFSILEPDMIAIGGHEYEVWVNSHGAVSAILSNGKQLGLKPDEFEIIRWHGEADDDQKTEAAEGTHEAADGGV